MIELEFGQTPWDNLSRDELLTEVRRMYSAINSLTSALHLVKNTDLISNLFWGVDGTGGKALSKGTQVIDKINKQYSAENLYRAYYRYADDLLFDSDEYDIGFNWVICPVCGTMLGDRENKINGMRCDEEHSAPGTCNGVFRPITFEDLKPKAI
jgi:hypothetical protein